jgi:hypothetical protein
MDTHIGHGRTVASQINVSGLNLAQPAANLATANRNPLPGAAQLPIDLWATGFMLVTLMG